MRKLQGLIGVVAALFAFSGVAVAQGTPPAPQAKVSRPKAEWFTRDAYMSAPQISPDGSRLAWVEGHRIVIYEPETDTHINVPGSDSALSNVDWINNDYLVAYLTSGEVQERVQLRFLNYSPMVFSRDGKFVRHLFADEKGKLVNADLKPIVGFVDGPAPFVVTLGGGNAYMTDVKTGKWKVGPRYMEGDVHLFDSKGNERVTVESIDGKPNYGGTQAKFRYRARPGGKVELVNLPKQENIYYIYFNYAEADNAFYWSEFNAATGVSSIYCFDMASGEKSLFRTVDSKDLSLNFDKSGKIVGITTLTDRVQTEWIDPYRLKLTAAVQKIFPKALVRITDMTGDGTGVVLNISAPDAPDGYYYYNTASKDLAQIGTNYPELEGETLAEMSYVTYKARDGLDIPAYVTRRKDTPANAPLIVMPHGGPAYRDVYGFHYEAQYLASRGYVVLQPQYRGSAGFGDTFQRAGNRNLDKMTTDLEDGVRYLKAQGMIDPARVCVVGWSWGGYLAQASLAFAPETYACGVSAAGVSDLSMALEDSNDWWWGGHGTEYWRAVIGQPLTDAKMIRATSPVEHVAAIRAPLLMIHGEEDYVVSAKQSERMNVAMTRAGKTVTYVPIKYMWHGPKNAAQRLEVLKTMDAFIESAFAGKKPN